jgi:uridine kinase
MNAMTWKPMLMGIAGGTGSGKTTLAFAIADGLPAGAAEIVQHDWYYRDRSHVPEDARHEINFDEPEALDNELLVAHLEDLRAGRSVEAPRYDFVSHTRRHETRTIPPARVILVEGILLYAVPRLRDLFDLRIFVDTDDDIRLLRRIRRDVIERGRDIDAIDRQYRHSVRPMHLAHVAPTRACAHLIIPEGGTNSQALDVIVGRLRHLLGISEAK